MDPRNIVGWTVVVLLLFSVSLRAVTLRLNEATLAGKVPTDEPVSQAGRWVLNGVAIAAATLAVAGSLWFPYPGLWGPAVLVVAVIWSVNAHWRVQQLPWAAPVQQGLEEGERIVLLGGALGTLIAYMGDLAT